MALKIQNYRDNWKFISLSQTCSGTHRFRECFTYTLCQKATGRKKKKPMKETAVRKIEALFVRLKKSPLTDQVKNIF